MEHKFKEIFDSYKNDIYRLSFSYTKSTSDSDDIVQKVFIKLYRHPQILNQKNTEIKKWLMKVTINECKTFLLSPWKNKIVAFTEKEAHREEKMSFDNQLLNVIMELPPKYRLMIYLYYYEGYKGKEIATLLKRSETNVQTRLSRAREKLKIILERDFE